MADRRLLLAATAGLLACESSGPAVGLVADLAVVPVFSATAAAPIPIDQARIRITRPTSRGTAELVLDSVVAFPIGAPQLTLRLRVPLKARIERLGLAVDLRVGPVPYFSAADSVTVTAAGSGPAAAPTLRFAYVGPGAEIRTLRITPRDSLLSFGDSLRFRLAASNAQGQPVTTFPVTWSTTDPQVGITDLGGLLAPPRRVAVRVIATLPTGLADSVTLTFLAKAVAAGVSAGAGQTAVPGATLPVPLRVVVKAADSLPVAGVTVRFRAIVGGGVVRDSVVTTDAAGLAATVATLGTVLGVQQFQATVVGIAPVVFGATALAGPAAAVRAVAGGGQVITAGQAATQPLLALVTDAGGFPVAGAVVDWTVLTGSGTVTAATSISNASGVAQIGAGAGPRRGLSVIRAAVAGAATQARFPLTTVAGPAAVVTAFNGNGVAVGADPLDPLEARVTDGLGNPIAGATVFWQLLAGIGSPAGTTSVTDARGIATMAFLPDTSFGTATVRAALSSGPQATFALPAGPPVGNVYITGGSVQSAFVGVALASALEVQIYDAGGFLVVGGQVDWSILEGGGTLTAGTTTTDASGIARVGYNPGPTAGAKAIQGRFATTGQIVRFAFDATPGFATGLLIASGDGQSVPAGGQLPLPLRVAVTDQFGNPLAGVSVAWSALSGGSVAAPVSVTDANGYATMTATVGSAPGQATFRAALQNTSVNFQATVN